MTASSSSMEGVASSDWCLPPGILLLTDPTSPDWQAAQGIETVAFIGRQFNQDEIEHAIEYRRHYHLSHYLIDDGLHGVVRVMLPSAVGFKTINDAHAGRLDISEAGWRGLAGLDHNAFVVECNIAVMEGYRGRPFDPSSLANRLVDAALMYTLQLAARHQVPPERTYILAGFDKQAYTLFSRLYAPAVWALGPVREYMGSPTIPTLLSVKEMIDYDQRERHGRLLKYAGELLIHGY